MVLIAKRFNKGTYFSQTIIWKFRCYIDNVDSHEDVCLHENLHVHGGIYRSIACAKLRLTCGWRAFDVYFAKNVRVCPLVFFPRSFRSFFWTATSHFTLAEGFRIRVLITNDGRTNQCAIGCERAGEIAASRRERATVNSLRSAVD